MAAKTMCRQVELRDNKVELIAIEVELEMTGEPGGPRFEVTIPLTADVIGHGDPFRGYASKCGGKHVIHIAVPIPANRH